MVVTRPGHTDALPAEFRGVQALRGLAALFVVTLHATLLWSEHVAGGTDALGWRKGGSGVDIFFAISGFVMMVSCSKQKATGAAAAKIFLKRRLLRIVPLYWTVTAVVLLKLWVVRFQPGLGENIEHVATTPGYILSSLFFIPWKNSLGTVSPLLPVGWTLSFEMFFYTLLAFALALKVEVLRVLTPVMIILAAVGIFYRQNWPPLTTLANPLLLEFLAGVFLGRAALRAHLPRASVAAALGVVGLTALLVVPVVSQSYLRLLVWGVPAFLLTLSVVSLEKQLGRYLPKWSLAIGDASYSLYLSHGLTFAVCARLLQKLDLITPGRVSRIDEIGVVLVAVPICVAVSIPLFYWFEQPVNRYLRRWLKTRDTPYMETDLHDRAARIQALEKRT